MWVRLTNRPVMTLDVYRGRKTTIQQQQQMAGVKDGLQTRTEDHKKIGALILYKGVSLQSVDCDFQQNK